jgi:hypothetical protein
MAINVIKVPKTPKRAFDTKRPASDLLKSQIEHFEWAVRPAAQRKPGKLRIKQVKTEGEAATRVEHLMRELQKQQAAIPAAAPEKPLEQPPASPPRKRRPAAASTRRSAAKPNRTTARKPRPSRRRRRKQS